MLIDERGRCEAEFVAEVVALVVAAFLTTAVAAVAGKGKKRIRAACRQVIKSSCDAAFIKKD